MNIDNTYQEVYQHLPDLLEQRRRNGFMPALGFTSNLDILCDFSTDKVNHLLNTYMPFVKLSEMKPVPLIKTMQDFLSTLVYYCRKGIGGENDIDSVSIIRDHFSDKEGMGGTAVQAAMALATIGCPSLVHLTDDSKEVCSILNNEHIYSVDANGVIVHTGDLVQTHEQEIHYIIQFKKGDQICLGDQKFYIPVSNRLILTRVTVNETVPLSTPFLDYVEHNADKIPSYVLSSFNCILDSRVLNDRLAIIKDNVRKYKKHNLQGVVYFEDAAYHDMNIKKQCIQFLYPETDIVGLNEDELKTTAEVCGIDVDIDDFHSCVKAARSLIELYHIKKGVIIHTKDFAMFIGNHEGFDIEKGLMYGNIIATSKAMTGWYGDFDALKKVLALKFSQKGTDFYNEAINKCYNDVVVVPSKYIDKPRYTIGLGDSFVAGVQICFGLDENYV